jgi:hypothetical protein
MDRIRAAAAPAAPTTSTPPAFPPPSLAAQLLLAAADQLTDDAPDETLTGRGWGIALALAGARVLAGYPAVVANNAAARAITALSDGMWDGARTRGEWALCLRAVARGL